MTFEDDDFRATVKTPDGRVTDITERIANAMGGLQMSLDDIPPDRIVLKFSGSVELSTEDVLLDALRLGKTVTVLVGEEDGDRVELDALVAGRAWTVKVDSETGEQVGTHAITLKVS